MKFTLESATSITIRSVSEDEIRIGDKTWSESIAVTSDGAVDTWTVDSLETLTDADFAALLRSDPEVVVLGTGNAHVIPPRDLMFAFARRGVGLEVMDTRAAARTFNVLAGEGRRVAAVLYL